MFEPLKRPGTPAWRTWCSLLGLLLLALPVSAQQTPGGAEVWSANCGRCHRPRAVDAYDARHWETVVTHMSLVARLTPDETDALREFLVGAARQRERQAGGAALARARPPAGQRSTGGSGGPASLDLWLWGPVPDRPPAACEPAGARVTFQTQCAACHGESGKGNGAAAAAMNPRPSDLTDSPRMARLTNDSLFQIVSKGRGAMPGFGTILKADQICAIVAYIRTLGRPAA